MNTDRTSSIWDMLALLTWAVVFAAGLVPDLAFDLLRGIAHVAPQDAIVNSSYAITIALSGYVGVFVLQRCREAGAGESEARAKAFVAACMGLAAFLELPSRGTSPFEPRTFLQVLVNFRIIEDTYVRNVILAAGVAKLFCWWYLFAMILRYYAFGNTRVFRTLPPSVSTPQREPAPKPESDAAEDATPAPSEATK